jgi:hypothetical protein
MHAEASGTAALMERFDQILTRVSARDKANIEKHLAFCDLEGAPGHGILWRRMVSYLSSLVPLPVQMAPQAVLFFVADGRYRMQVFALEDRKDGLMVLYLPDVLEEAVAQELLVQTDDGYAIPGPRTLSISIQPMNAQNTPDPAPHFKHLIGWNRKALRITLNATDPDHPQVRTAEALAALAATKWENAPRDPNAPQHGRFTAKS